MLEDMEASKQLSKTFPVKFLAVLLTCLIAWGLTYLAFYVFRDYAVGLFVWLPLSMGALVTLLINFRNPRPASESRKASFLSLLLYCIGLLLFAWDGLICILMAAPFGVLFTWIGHIMTHYAMSKKVKNTPTTVVLLLVFVPAFMAFENKLRGKPALRSVTTAIKIKAGPEKVWQNVISFPELSQPSEFIFKTGIAYPINASIEGNGVGAIRRCNFSTGSFLEPITVWNAPNLLKFAVDEQPEPMKELSPYDIHPNHLHGYWISKQGQFRLTKLPNGHTLLEGTTWFENKVKPDLYWTLWSDYIVHKIHDRVLRHIKLISE